jgi:hypothetical protein
MWYAQISMDFPRNWRQDNFWLFIASTRQERQRARATKIFNPTKKF